MDTLIQNLQNPALFPHPVLQFKVIETHLSWVILTGEFAYKIKKPVNFGFVDFSTLEKRHFFCLEEVKLNQTLCKSIYLDVISISGTPKEPQFSDSLPPIEYAIKMKQFQQENLFENLHQHHQLTNAMFQSIARQLARFHQDAETAKPDTPYGSFQSVQTPALDNFTVCEELVFDKSYLPIIQTIQKWTIQQLGTLASLIHARKENHMIKNCHGDVHLRNIVLIDDQPVIFDCIEFNQEFRWIDPINEIAFLCMDLYAENEVKLAIEFLNEYFLHSNDYVGFPLLSFYMVYRAMIRAKVALLTNDSETKTLFARYIHLANQLTSPNKPNLFLVRGLSGSGKTHLSQNLAPQLSAIHIRSDALRQHLAQNIPASVKYSNEMTEEVYRQLATNSLYILKEGFNVLVDATFLMQQQRQLFQQLADTLNIPIVYITCEASSTCLEARIQKRLKSGNDLSEANLEVLHQQLRTQEPLMPQEKELSIVVNTEKNLAQQDYQILLQDLQKKRC